MSVFSTISDDKKLHIGNSFFMIYDGFPVSKGHILIISNEEKEDYFSLSKSEQTELSQLINNA